MPKGIKGSGKRPEPKNDNFQEIIDEIAIEYGIDKNLMDRFIRRWVLCMYRLIRKKKDFQFKGIGTFKFPYRYSKERGLKSALKLSNKNGKKINKAKKKARLKAKKRYHKIVNKYLRKNTNQLEIVLSLYK